jgi:RimJ/RimL family protein N-acetyltransferase
VHSPGRAADVWRGENVLLRPIEPEDWHVLADIEYDADSARLGNGFVPTPFSLERLRVWCAEKERSEMQADSFRWMIRRVEDDVAVGVINTHHCDLRTGVFSYGVMIFAEHRRRRYASDAINLVLGYYFDERRYQKAAVSVYAFNDASLDLHSGLGFRSEGVARRAEYTEGVHHDVVWLGLTVEEFRDPLRLMGERSEGPDPAIQFETRPTLDDDELQDLFARAWGEPKVDFGPVLERSFTWIAAYSESRLVGFVNVAWDGGVHFFLLDTTVDPDHQHRGIGTELVRRAIAACRDHGHWIHVDSGAELGGFYRGAGFRNASWAGLAWLGEPS